MEKTEMLIMLEVMNEYMPQLKMVKDLLDKTKKGEMTSLTDKQKSTLQRLFNQSYSKSKMEIEYARRLEQNETLQVSRQMTRKFESTRTINASPAEILRYNSEGEVERTPIGFKQKQTQSRYHLDVSTENIKRTKLERFDALFND